MGISCAGHYSENEIERHKKTLNAWTNHPSETGAATMWALDEIKKLERENANLKEKLALALPPGVKG